MTLAWSGAVAAASPPRATVAPAVQHALGSGLRGPRGGRLPARRVGRAAVVVRLRHEATEARLGELARTGAELASDEGGWLSYDRFVPARVDAASLAALAALPSVERIDLAPAPGPPPMDRSAQLTHLAAARGSRPALGDLTGAGTTVADLDSNVDVLQPVFFRGDAGYFDWLDLDGDGVFTPENDAIDLDRDGQASDGERASWLKAETTLLYGPPVPARADSFDAGIDWIYLDTNGNGSRDQGQAAGFDDATPALGEPLFTPDDVNQNGRLDAGERVVRLGTSKFAAIHVRVDETEDAPAVVRTFKRGVDLLEKRNDYAAGAYGYPETLHATGVLTIVAGDLPLVGRRWAGFAPDADLLLGYELSQSGMGAVTWALKQKPTVVLHETANWTGEVLDGSDPYSAMVTASATKDQIAHTCPVGNTGTARKHTHLELAAKASASLGFEVPSGDYHYVNLTLNARTGEDLGVTLRLPDGSGQDVGTSPLPFDGLPLADGTLLFAYQQTSSRGTRLVDVYLYNVDQPIAPGAYRLELAGSATQGGTVDGYLSDEVSSWGLGVAWDEAIATDDRTIGVPAVADECLAIGAMPGHLGTEGEWWNEDSPEKAEQRRGYSGQGPRIDGALRPDVLAPDNPWVAVPDTDLYGEPIPVGGVWPFSGTSGAGPHATGVTALLAQAGIRGVDAYKAIRQGARPSQSAPGPLPDNEYGHGVLDAAGAFGVAPVNQPPTVVLTQSPPSARPGDTVTLTATVTDPDGDASAAEVRWDDGYDGTWDSGYAAPTPRAVTSAKVARVPVKVRARDAAGQVAEAIAWVAFSDEPPPVAGSGGSSGQGGAGGDPGGQGGAGVSGASGQGGAPVAAADSDDDDGCGCRAAGRGRAAGAGGLAAAAALAAVRRRRRHA